MELIYIMNCVMSLWLSSLHRLHILRSYFHAKTGSAWFRDLRQAEKWNISSGELKNMFGSYESQFFTFPKQFFKSVLIVMADDSVFKEIVDASAMKKIECIRFERHNSMRTYYKN